MYIHIHVQCVSYPMINHLISQPAKGVILHHPNLLLGRPHYEILYGGWFLKWDYPELPPKSLDHDLVLKPMVLGIHHFKKTPKKKHYLYVDQSHPTPWPRYSKGYSRRAPKFRKFGRNRFLDSFLFWLCLIGLTVTSSSRSSCSYENGHKWMFPLPQKNKFV